MDETPSPSSTLWPEPPARSPARGRVGVSLAARSSVRQPAHWPLGRPNPRPPQRPVPAAKPRGPAHLHRHTPFTPTTRTTFLAAAPGTDCGAETPKTWLCVASGSLPRPSANQHGRRPAGPAPPPRPSSAALACGTADPRCEVARGFGAVSL